MELIYPMFVMVILTFIVGAMMAYSRVKSTVGGERTPQYFKLISRYDLDDQVEKLGRNFSNLFEVPILFYAGSVLAIALNLNSQALIVMAWFFVGFRIVHTVIHITYNKPLHRFIPFVFSFFCTVAMWVNLVGLVSRAD